MLAHLIDTYLADLAADEVAPGTIARDRRSLAAWRAWLAASGGVEHPQSWTPATVGAFLASRSGSARRRDAATLREFRVWLETEGYASPQLTGGWQNR